MRLWAITDASQDDDAIASRASDACAAAREDICIHLRDKTRARRDLAHRLSAIARAHGSTLVIGDHEDLAREVGASVHGWNARAPFSVGAHSDDEVSAALSRGVRAVLVSPIFETPGKGPPRGLGAIERAVRLTTVPIYALGGVDESNARACIEAGARGVAVMRAVFSAKDAARAARALLCAMDGR
jgi:thiamine-phosphate pyrophosphorylase